jgi:protein TonB
MNTKNERSAPNAPSSVPDDLAVRLVRRAARLSPVDLAERLEEEWLADLAQQTGALSRLRFALGCARATRVIASDAIALEPAPARVVSPAASAIAYAPLGGSRGSNRSIALFAIVALHVLLIYGFANGLGVHVFRPAPPVIIGHTLSEHSPPEPLPPTVLPHIGTTLGPIDFAPEKPTFEQVKPEVPVTTAGMPTGLTPSVEPVKSYAAASVTHIPGGPATDFPSTADYYPSLSRQLGETGAATVDVCVDPRGRLSGEPRIRDSSGISRLDDAALSLARAGSGHYRPSTESGQAVSGCYPFRVRFSLRR